MPDRSDAGARSRDRELSRRALLARGGGLLGAAGLAGVGWGPVAAAAPRAALFPGDPGPGVVLSGGSVWSGSAGVPSAIDWLDDHTGKAHVLARTYSSVADAWHWSAIDAAIAVGRIPFTTTKFTAYPAAQIVSGAADAALATEASRAIARAPAPLWLGYYHEPEDNFPSDAAAADFRAACRYIVGHLRGAGVTNVAWVFPAWMVRWSFDGGVGARGNAWKWDPDWRGTLSGAGGVPDASDWYTGSESVVDLIGMDQYTPTVGGSSYHTFAWDVGFSLDKLASWGRPRKPVAIAELGTADITPTPDWTAHYAQLLQTCIDYDVRGFACYNTDSHNFVNADATGRRFAGYRAMVGDPRVLGVSA